MVVYNYKGKNYLVSSSDGISTASSSSGVILAFSSSSFIHCIRDCNKNHVLSSDNLHALVSQANAICLSDTDLLILKQIALEHLEKSH
jgi:hypothetical protein